MDREFDVVVWGATGFTGRRIVKDLSNSYGPDGQISWAAAGRSEEKLRAVCAEAGAPDATIIVADSADQPEIDAMARRAKLVIAAAGPYADFGSSTVAACAAAGTDYVDITGELTWVRSMIDQYADLAEASGARIVHCCGFDCIPFDHGVLFTQKIAQETFGEVAQEVLGRIKAVKVAPSGGSAATAMSIMNARHQDSEIDQLMDDPFALAPDPEAQRSEQPDARAPRLDPETGTWAVEFPMSMMNMAIVHRSNMLLGYPYGQDFTYSEMLAVRSQKSAQRRQRIQAFALRILSLPPAQALAKRFLLPKQGDGPSSEKLAEGFFVVDFIAKGPAGKTIRTRVKCDLDPGYIATPLMTIEAAMSLLQDTPREVTPGGIYSPAAALKEPFIERLEKSAGLLFQHVE
ncbi:MAG: saccharopine dehydrogenase NADP-binding domain-containing protein [Pseudomonadota bacterium]